MKKNGFTLVEVIIIVVVIGILASVAIPAYQNVIEDSNARVCEQNLKALKAALDIYAMEYDSLPASLSQLPQEYINKAYASLSQQRRTWRIKLAYFILDLQHRGFAYAGFLRDGLAKGNISLITCPKDTTPPAQGGRSYGLNSVLAGKSNRDYQNLSAGVILIGDSENATFSGDALTMRHKYSRIGGKKPHGLGVAKNGKTKVKKSQP